MNIHKWFTNFFHGWFLDKWEVSVGWRASSTAIQLFIHRRFSGFVVRVIEKSKILVYRQKVSFLFCFVLAYSYLCNQVSVRSFRGGAGMIFEENNNSISWLFGTSWNVRNFWDNSYQRWSLVSALYGVDMTYRYEWAILTASRCR